MSKGTVAALVVGWLLGIVTAFTIPRLVYQRQSIYAASPSSGDLRSEI
jgi:hypothetical protein